MAVSQPTVASLVAASADIVTIAQYVSDEIAESLASEQINSSMIEDLARIKTIMDEIVTAFGG